MNFPAKKILPRYIVIFFLFTVAGVAIIARAAYLIFGDKEYWMAVSARFKKENQEVPATRGNILAAGGEVLATSLPEYKIFMDFMTWEKDPKRKARAQFVRDSLLEDKMDSICNGMHAIFPDIDPAKLRAHLLKGRKKKSHHWPIYHKRITYLQYKQVKALPLFKMSANSGGFHCDEIKLRKNPYGELARRTVGLFTYKGEDEVLTGLELAFDSVLRGKPGSAHRQKVLSRYLTIVDQPAEDGLDIQTTIDVNFQDICEKALNDKLVEIGANQGLCILMEVQTGDVKAITSMRRVGDGVYKEMDVDAVKNLLEPGSVFKPVSFLVAMNDGYIDMDDWVDTGCGIRPMYGRNMKDHNHRSGGYGVLTVPQILQKSSNIGVSVLIDKFYHNQPEKFVDGVYSTGIAEDLHLPIPGYAKPRIRRPLPDGSNWSKTALPWMSIGYETQIPPISTLNFYNGIANNGKMLQPRFVKAILKNGEVVKEFPVKVIREQMASPEAVKKMQICLEQVVSIGLGKKAGSKQFHSSGKTGTAQIWTKSGFSTEYLISFAGYFPSENPKYSCIVCIRKTAPASGGGMCGPVFRRVSETVMAQQRNNTYDKARDTVHVLTPKVAAGDLHRAKALADDLKVGVSSNLPESGSAWGSCESGSGVVALNAETPAAAGRMPDLSGYGLRDAVFRLEKMGLRVTANGSGRVKKQSIAPGTAVERGASVSLTLANDEAAPQVEKPEPKPEPKGEGTQPEAAATLPETPQKPEPKKQQ